MSMKEKGKKKEREQAEMKISRSSSQCQQNPHGKPFLPQIRHVACFLINTFLIFLSKDQSWAPASLSSSLPRDCEKHKIDEIQTLFSKNLESIWKFQALHTELWICKDGIRTGAEGRGAHSGCAVQERNRPDMEGMGVGGLCDEDGHQGHLRGGTAEGRQKDLRQSRN